MITPKQKEILDYINQYKLTHGYSPTLEEIANKFKKSVPTIHQHVQALRTKGYLKLPSTYARKIGVYDPNEEIIEILLMGYISAGGGIDNLENPEPIKVQRTLLSSSGQHFALIVRGDSMVDDGILQDDIIVVRTQNHADNGDVVVALMGSDEDACATVKRYYHHGSRIELRPRNPNLPPMMCNPGDVEIRGKFVGLLRKG